MSYTIPTNKQTGDQLTALEWNEIARAVNHLLDSEMTVDSSINVLIVPNGTDEPDRYQLTPYVEEVIEYSDITISSFSYGTLPNTAGNKNPSLNYSQIKTTTNSQGTVTEEITSGATPVYSFTPASGIEGVSINSASGKLTYGANSEYTQRTLGIVTVVITLNGKTQTANCTITQAAAAEPNILMYGQIDISESNITDILGGEASIGSFIQASAISDFQELPNYNVDDNNPATSNDVYSQMISRNSTGYCIMVYMLSNTNHNVIWFSELENSKFPIVQLSDYYSDYPSTCQYSSQNYSYNNKSYKLVAFVTSSNEDNNYKIQIQNS